MKKILFVTTNNYPYSGTCSNILSNIINEGNLIKSFENISVLACKKTINDDDIESVNAVTVYRVLSWSLVQRNELKECLQSKKICPFISGFIWKLLLFFYKKILKNDFYDFVSVYAFYKSLKKYHAEKFDAIISISGRYGASIAVEKFAKKHNIEFILYQVDPAATNKVYNKKTQQQRLITELSLYSSASKIFTTPIIYQEHSLDVFSRYLSKMISLEFPVVKPTSYSYQKNNPLRAIYCGSFYGNIRNPDYTIALFKDLVLKGIVSLEFVGNIDDSLKKYASILPIKCWGNKTIQECQNFIQQADILINVGNVIDNQIPSKIFEYISTGKPIVNVCKVKKCPTLPYLSRYTSAFNCFEDYALLNKQKNDLKKFVNSLPSIIGEEEILEKFGDCTPRSVAQIIRNCLK